MLQNTGNTYDNAKRYCETCLELLTLSCLVSTLMSSILKQTCSFQLQVCLSVSPFRGHKTLQGSYQKPNIIDYFKLPSV